jgi:hypothetical protein
MSLPTNDTILRGAQERHHLTGLPSLIKTTKQPLACTPDRVEDYRLAIFTLYLRHNFSYDARANLNVCYDQGFSFAPSDHSNPKPYPSF